MRLTEDQIHFETLLSDDREVCVVLRQSSQPISKGEERGWQTDTHPCDVIPSLSAVPLPPPPTAVHPHPRLAAPARHTGRLLSWRYGGRPPVPLHHLDAISSRPPRSPTHHTGSCATRPTLHSLVLHYIAPQHYTTPSHTLYLSLSPQPLRRIYTAPAYTTLPTVTNPKVKINQCS